MISMAENKLADMSTEFAIQILKLTENIKGHYSLSNQLERSGTSIGANITEAQYPQSLPDMLSKFKIARKECVETESWLKLLFSNNSIDELTFKKHRNLCGRIQRMLTASCITIEKKITKE